MELLSAIRRIIARKIVERKQPYVATAMEVYSLTGIEPDVQRDEAEVLVAKGVITTGRTFNGIYYKLKEQW